MNEDILNMSLRKFLKKVGVTAQREIEMAIRAAVEAKQLKGNERLEAGVRLRIPAIGLDVPIDGTIELE